MHKKVSLVFQGALLIGVSIWLTGCVPRPVARPPENRISPYKHKREAIHLAEVPFYPNTTDKCGPAALASVLNYWDKSVTLEQIKAEVFHPRLRGTLPMDMRPALEKQGLSAQVVSGSFEDIKKELRLRRPVVAYLDFGTKKHSIGHFLVVTGFDDERKGLIVHSGPRKNKFASYRRFDRGWKDANRWMMTVGPTAARDTPSSRSPLPIPGARLNAGDHFKLGTIYENQGLDSEAVTQYQLALKENKNFEPALIALGNLAFASGDYRQAEKYYRRVLRTSPDHGGANNNLAMVYLKTGKKLQTAKAHALKAADTDAYRLYAEDTLKQIQDKLARQKTLH